MRDKVRNVLLDSFVSLRIDEFLKNKDLSQLAIKTSYCELVFTRMDDSKNTQIIGFAEGSVQQDDDYEDDNQGDYIICKKVKNGGTIKSPKSK